MLLISNFNKKLTGLKLRTLIFVTSIIIITVILSVAAYFSYKETSTAIMNIIENADESSLKQADNKLTSVMEEMEKLTRSISENDMLISYLVNFEKVKNDQYEKAKIHRDITSQLIKIEMTHNEIESIRLYSNSSSFITKGVKESLTHSIIKKSGIYRKIISAGSNVAVIEPDNNALSTKNVFNNIITGISFARVIYNNGEEIGSVIIVMNRKWMEKMFGAGSNMIFARKEGKDPLWAGNSTATGIFYDARYNFIYDKGNLTYKYKNDDYRVYYTHCKYNDWVLVSFKKVQDILIPLDRVRDYALFAILVSIVMSFTLSGIISRKITKPVYKLIEAAKKYNMRHDTELVDLDTGTKRRSFRKNITLFMVAVIIVPLLMYNFTFYITTSRIMVENIKKSVLMAFRQTTSNIDGFAARSERISAGIMFNRYLQDFLVNVIEKKNGNGVDDNSSFLISSYKIIKDIYAVMSAEKSVFDVSLYGTDGNVVHSTNKYGPGFMEEKLFERISKTFGGSEWIYSADDRRLLLARKIWGILVEKYSNKAVGYLTMSFTEKNIEGLYSDISLKDSNIYIIDNKGVILSHKSKQTIGQPSGYKPDEDLMKAGSRILRKDGRNYLVIFVECKKLPWILVGEIPYELIMKESREILVRSLIFQLIIVLTALLAVYRLSYIFTGSIGMLNSNLVKLGQGDTGVDFSGRTRINEIEELGCTFNDMARRIQELINEVYYSQLKEKELENDKKDAELIALQTQINPHFLYNTLESIRWMIKEDEKEIASEMVSSLGDLFKLGISNEKNMITIEEEIQYTKTYIFIQKQRFGKKLQSQWIVDEKVLQCLTPKLLLQPLIENCINHGFGGKKKEINISICCREEGGQIVFKVSDNGKGIDGQKLEKIKKDLNGGLTGKSIGMYNVQKRIKLYFGELYGIFVESGENKGTTVTAHIPVSSKNNTH